MVDSGAARLDEAARAARMVDSGAARPDCTVADLHRHLLGAHSPPGAPAKTQSEVIPRELEGRGAASSLMAPGGFRRQFLRSQAEAEGREPPGLWRQSLLESLQPLITAGHFEAVLGIDEEGRKRAHGRGASGEAQTALALWKGMVGTGITYLPRAVAEGGWLFSGAALLVLGLGQAVCIERLVQCCVKTGGATDYGGIAERASGPLATKLVQVSLVVSQFGVVTSYLIFVNKVVGSIVSVPTGQLIVAQLVLMVPLALSRSIHKLELPNLLANVLVIFGLAVILWCNADALVARGLSPDLQAFEPSTCGLFVGVAVFTFEGVPLMLPIRESMREPERFLPVFVPVFATVVALFTAFGVLGYADFGRGCRTVALNNLPAGTRLTLAVKVLYSSSLILGAPLQFIPAVRIVELWTFGVTERGARKWSKNLLRLALFAVFACFAVYGSSYFEQFLAFVGALCSVPIGFIYPAWFHLRLCARSGLDKAVDLFFISAGIAAMVFVLVQTLLPDLA